MVHTERAEQVRDVLGVILPILLSPVVVEGGALARSASGAPVAFGEPSRFRNTATIVVTNLPPLTVLYLQTFVVASTFKTTEPLHPT